MAGIEFSDIQTVGTAPAPEKAKSVKIKITARYFKTTKRGLWQWCIPAITPGCVINVAYRDISMDLEVGFRNNVLSEDPMTGVIERLNGALYFFKLATPTP